MIDIAVHELNKYYGANHVIKNASFEIYSGEKIGLTQVISVHKEGRQ